MAAVVAEPPKVAMTEKEQVKAALEMTKNMSVEEKKAMLLNGAVAEMFFNKDAGDAGEVQTAEELAALAGTVDPRALPAWDHVLGCPPFEGQTDAQIAAIKQAYMPGPVAKIYQMCMPLRARGAMALGSMTGLSPDCQWLRTLIQLVTMVCAYDSSRRFFISDPEGLEVLMLDFEDPCKVCPASVPRGPDGRRALIKRSLPDVTDEEMAFILKSDKSAWTEADEDAAKADPPFFAVRFQHVLKGLPGTDAKLLAAFGASDDGYVNAKAVEAHASKRGVMTVQAECVDEVRAAVAMLTKNAAMLAPTYLEHFAGQSKYHAPAAGTDPAASDGAYVASFLVPPHAVPERPPPKPCANPACGKEEAPGAAERFMTCTACKMEHYCCKGCQKAHWPTHKEPCATVKARIALIADAVKAQKVEKARASFGSDSAAGGGKDGGTGDGSGVIGPGAGGVNAGGKKAPKKGRGKRDKVN